MLAATAQQSSAQWLWNTTNGNWNLAGNWSPATLPASAVTTGLTFNGTTYTSNNDLGNPFVLNGMTFGNTGLVNITGNQLSFGGASPAINIGGAGAVTMTTPILVQSPAGANSDVLTIGGTGAGVLTLYGALSSNTVCTSGGGSIRQTNPNGNLVLGGGGNLYSMRASAGSITINGGSWSLASGQRQNYYITGNNTGFWGLNIGDTPGAVTASR